ncbi:N-acetyltransferase [Bombiscardovia apis]|uniref:N-acetyltransferase n=1 Tax=Bombiscardovia apis TaxID=2932182 RepID=A0ABM8BAG7_9BIFI|nr:GNAT family N-acetyltransferase [Bombiscardovia apis]BDR53909.1 N-acetyltransferase [Bombiscardovia apis]
MVRLEAITKDNFFPVLELKRPEGEGYVPDNALSIAEAWLYRNEGTSNPRAMYDDDKLVGFVMTHDSADKPVRDIWRILIPEEFANKGYGSQALRILIDEATADEAIEQLKISYMPGNDRAEHVYRKAGFVPNGEKDGEEIVMEYRF